MNPIAIELNNSIEASSLPISQMLSKLGLELYMPKGILTQGAQAKEKAYKFNATIGIATVKKDEKIIPMHLECISRHIKDFEVDDIFNYAPAKGLAELRKEWRKKIYQQTPSLSGKAISTPVVTNALTHGLSISADLFCNEGDYVVTADKFWGNYRLAFTIRRGANIATFKTFTGNNFNVKGLIEKVSECGKLKPKVIVLLNFPNNPTGYTPTVTEAEELVQGLKNIADSGVNLVCITDDAYYGMFYFNSIKESIFGMLAGISPNLLAVKLDGATKELFVWGLRVGFITFASTSATGENPTPKESSLFTALEQKVEGDIRGTISNVSRLSQTMVLHALKDPDCKAQMEAGVVILSRRARKAMEIVSNKKYHDRFTAYPFNSGYFLCLKFSNTDTEKLRVYLLDNFGIGTISTSSKDLRVAFSSVEENDLQELFDNIYYAAQNLV